jgi:hypothetical protein
VHTGAIPPSLIETADRAGRQRRLFPRGSRLVGLLRRGFARALDLLKVANDRDGDRCGAWSNGATVRGCGVRRASIQRAAPPRTIGSINVAETANLNTDSVRVGARPTIVALRELESGGQCAAGRIARRTSTVAVDLHGHGLDLRCLRRTTACSPKSSRAS